MRTSKTKMIIVLLIMIQNLVLISLLLKNPIHKNLLSSRSNALVLVLVEVLRNELLLDNEQVIIYFI